MSTTEEFEFCSSHYALDGFLTLAPNGNKYCPLGRNLSLPSRLYSVLDGVDVPHDGNGDNWHLLGVLLSCQVFQNLI